MLIKLVTLLRWPHIQPKHVEVLYNTHKNMIQLDGVKGRRLVHTQDGVLPKVDTDVLRWVLGYLPGVVDVCT